LLCLPPQGGFFVAKTMDTERNYKEKEPKLNNSMSFTVMRPGGNDTALFMEIIEDSKQRRKLNDIIMKFYPNVEQVGFVTLGKKPKLLMAGGEFCGNATRSTAWLALKGKQGTVNILVSGVRERLKAGVAENGEAFSQMPIFSDFSKLKNDPQNSENIIVEMEGITHLVTFDTEQIDELSEEEIKKKSMQMIRSRGLDQKPAAGIIYVQQTKDGWKIDPVVYVKAIDTLFYETACGSGTTALGLVLALKSKKNIKEVSVLQPSGLPIKISVDYAEKGFGKAQIQGPIEIMTTGTLEKNTNFDYIVEQVRSKKQLTSLLQNGLVKLYQQIFSDAPYFEEFTDEEVTAYYDYYFKNGLISVAKDEREIIGFAATVALYTEPEIAELSKKFGIDPDTTLYFAELGVTKELRRQGIGERICQEQLRKLSKGATILVRTAADNFIAQTLYKKLGFQEVIGMKQDVSQARIDGAVQIDKRVFLVKKL